MSTRRGKTVPMLIEVTLPEWLSSEDSTSDFTYTYRSDVMFDRLKSDLWKTPELRSESKSNYLFQLQKTTETFDVDFKRILSFPVLTELYRTRKKIKLYLLPRRADTREVAFRQAKESLPNQDSSDSTPGKTSNIDILAKTLKDAEQSLSLRLSMICDWQRELQEDIEEPQHKHESVESYEIRVATMRETLSKLTQVLDATNAATASNNDHSSSTPEEVTPSTPLDGESVNADDDSATTHDDAGDAAGGGGSDVAKDVHQPIDASQREEEHSTTAKEEPRKEEEDDDDDGEASAAAVEDATTDADSPPKDTSNDDDPTDDAIVPGDTDDVAAASEEKPSSAPSKLDRLRDEFLATEKSYLDGLEIIVVLYLRELKKNSLLSSSDMETVFSNVETLFNIHTILYNDISSGGDSAGAKELASAFGRFVPFLKMYKEYVTNFDKAAKCLKRRKQKSSKLSAFLEEVRQKPECGKLDLESYLIMPVQRLPRYELLLRDIGRAIPPEDEEVRCKIEKLLNTVQDVNKHVNAAKTEAENRDLMRKLNHFTKAKGINIFDRVDRQLLLDRSFEIFHHRPKRGESNPSNPWDVDLGGARFSTRRFFLFDDYFLVIQENRGHFKLIRDFDNARTKLVAFDSKTNTGNKRTGALSSALLAQKTPPPTMEKNEHGEDVPQDKEDGGDGGDDGVVDADGDAGDQGDGVDGEDEGEEEDEGKSAVISAEPHDGDGGGGQEGGSGAAAEDGEEEEDAAGVLQESASSVVTDLPTEEQMRLLALERKGEWFFCRFSDAKSKEEWQAALSGAQMALLKPDSDALRRRMRKEATAQRNENQSRRHHKGRGRRHRDKGGDRRRRRGRSSERDGPHGHHRSHHRRGRGPHKSKSSRDNRRAKVERSRSLGRAASRGLAPRISKDKSNERSKGHHHNNDGAPASANNRKTSKMGGRDRRRSWYGKGAQKMEKGQRTKSPGRKSPRAKE